MSSDDDEKHSAVFRSSDILPRTRPRRSRDHDRDDHDDNQNHNNRGDGAHDPARSADPQLRRSAASSTALRSFSLNPEFLICALL
jgi:hypothetical protein